MKHPCQEIITADGVRGKQERIFPQKKKKDIKAYFWTFNV